MYWLFHHRFVASAHSFGKRRKCQVFTHGDYCWCRIAIQGASRFSNREDFPESLHSELQVGILYSQYSIETHSSAIEFRTSSLLLHFNISSKETIFFQPWQNCFNQLLNWWINSRYSVQEWYCELINLYFLACSWVHLFTCYSPSITQSEAKTFHHWLVIGISNK